MDLYLNMPGAGKRPHRIRQQDPTPAVLDLDPPKHKLPLPPPHPRAPKRRRELLQKLAYGTPREGLQLEARKAARGRESFDDHALREVHERAGAGDIMVFESEAQVNLTITGGRAT